MSIREYFALSNVSVSLGRTNRCETVRDVGVDVDVDVEVLGNMTDHITCGAETLGVQPVRIPHTGSLLYVDFRQLVRGVRTESVYQSDDEHLGYLETQKQSEMASSKSSRTRAQEPGRQWARTARVVQPCRFSLAPEMRRHNFGSWTNLPAKKFHILNSAGDETLSGVYVLPPPLGTGTASTRQSNTFQTLLLTMTMSVLHFVP